MYKLKHLHYRRNYKGEKEWSLITAEEARKSLAGKYVYFDEALEDLDNHKRLETDLAFYEL